MKNKKLGDFLLKSFEKLIVILFLPFSAYFFNYFLHFLVFIPFEVEGIMLSGSSSSITFSECLFGSLESLLLEHMNCLPWHLSYKRVRLFYSYTFLFYNHQRMHI